VAKDDFMEEIELPNLFRPFRAMEKAELFFAKGRAAPPGFDGESFYKACESENIIPNVKPNPRNQSEEQRLEPYQSGTHIFNEELYKDRSVIEHSNAWIDGFKALLVRFEFSVRNWTALHFIAFSVIFLRKINKKIKV
jgi:hypothetical protein